MAAGTALVVAAGRASESFDKLATWFLGGGISLDVNARFSAHIAGLGANFTKTHKPIRIIETFSCETDDKDIASKLDWQKKHPPKKLPVPAAVALAVYDHRVLE